MTSQVECDALVLSRRPKGEEFRAADAKGGKNRRRASARRELQDVAGLICLGLIYLGYKEIARAVKGQAPRKTQARSENALHRAGSELKDSVIPRICEVVSGHEQIAAAIEGQAYGIYAGVEGAWSGENGARSIRSEFVDRLCATVCCVEIARAVESQAPAWLWLIVPGCTRNGAEDDPLSIRCEFEDSPGQSGTVVI